MPDREFFADFFRGATVHVPVAVEPYTRSGRARVYCCGTPQILPDNTHCGDIADGGSNFIIRQALCVDIPVRVGASAAAGEAYILCPENIR